MLQLELEMLGSYLLLMGEYVLQSYGYQKVQMLHRRSDSATAASISGAKGPELPIHVVQP